LASTDVLTLWGPFEDLRTSRGLFGDGFGAPGTFWTRCGETAGWPHGKPLDGGAPDLT